MGFPTRLSQLCLPAKTYFILSAIGILLMVVQNLNNGDGMYTLGTFSRRIPSKILLFSLKVGYVLFWTWVLNLICRDGHSSVSWLLVLLPFVLGFVMMGAIMLA